MRNIVVLFVVLLSSFNVQAQIDIDLDVIDISKLSKGQIRVLFNKYNDGLIIANKKLRLELSNELAIFRAETKRIKDSSAYVNRRASNILEFKLDSASNGHKYLYNNLKKITSFKIDSIDAVLSGERKILKEERRKVNAYNRVIWTACIVIFLLVALIVYVNKKLRINY